MSKEMWTPGPWEAQVVTSDMRHYTNPGDAQRVNSTASWAVGPIERSTYRAMADAHLIAAAPDMAVGIAQMLAHEDAGGDGWWAGWDKCKAALAKARGATP